MRGRQRSSERRDEEINKLDLSPEKTEKETTVALEAESETEKKDSEKETKKKDAEKKEKKDVVVEKKDDSIAPVDSLVRPFKALLQRTV